VHGQDIAIPLGRSRDSNPEAAAFAGSKIWSRRFMLMPSDGCMGLRLIATQTDCTVGAGPEAASERLRTHLRRTGCRLVLWR
jgi:hypothetical protein